MSHYELIGFDMDGTILNSQKTISHRTLEAVNRAACMGKRVILSLSLIHILEDMQKLVDEAKAP